MDKRLYRSNTNKIIGGVCGGLGEYFDVDPTLVRIIFIVLALATGVFFLAYILAWIIIPKREYDIPGQSPPESDQAHSYTPPEPADRNTEYSSWTRYLPGLILILIGVILLFRETFYWFDLDEFWPVVLIVLGLALIVGRQTRNKAREEAIEENSSTTDNGGAAT